MVEGKADKVLEGLVHSTSFIFLVYNATSEW